MKTCTITDFTYAELNSDCGDLILERAFASKFDKIAMSFDHTSSSIGKFDVTSADYQFNASVPEPLLYFIGQCEDSNFKIKWTDLELTKTDLGTILVLSDILILSVLIFGLNTIYYMQKDFVKQFDKTSVEARDFTLVVENLPESFKQYKDELSLKYAIWS